jgi:AbrB family looped-hinge helix DNA binding protein
MKYETTITSKGTITIASPIRKALGLKPGQKVRQSIDKNNKVVIDPGTTWEEFEALRARIVSKIPKDKLGLTGQALHREIEKAKIAEYGKKYCK